MGVVSEKSFNEKKAKAWRAKAKARDEIEAVKEVASIVNLIGERFGKISTRTGYCGDRARRLVGIAHKCELIIPLDQIEKNKIALKALDAEEPLKEAAKLSGLSESEILLLAEKAKRLHLLNPKMFIG